MTMNSLIPNRRARLFPSQKIQYQSSNHDNHLFDLYSQHFCLNSWYLLIVCVYGIDIIVNNKRLKCGQV